MNINSFVILNFTRHESSTFAKIVIANWFVRIIITVIGIRVRLEFVGLIIAFIFNFDVGVIVGKAMSSSIQIIECFLSFVKDLKIVIEILRFGKIMGFEGAWMIRPGFFN